MRWLFSYGFVDEFAAALLKEVAPRLPKPDVVGTKPGKVAKHEQRRESVLGLLHRRAIEFHQTEKLNFFQRARLSKQLQDGLIQSGQTPEFAQSVALEVISELK